MIWIQLHLYIGALKMRGPLKGRPGPPNGASRGFVGLERGTKGREQHMSSLLEFASFFWVLHLSESPRNSSTQMFCKETLVVLRTWPTFTYDERAGRI